MSKLSLKTVLTASALTVASSTAAFAQVTYPETETAPATVQTAPDAKIHLAKADKDFDGSLDAAEYVEFVVAMAEDGDEDSGALVVSGDYDANFRTLDADGDGELTEDELHAKAGDDTSMDESFGDDPDM
ncbi:MAG: hypothetical protein WBG08_14130 [Litorimonas sp.]